jgi:hypothetical protein
MIWASRRVRWFRFVIGRKNSRTANIFAFTSACQGLFRESVSVSVSVLFPDGCRVTLVPSAAVDPNALVTISRVRP